MSTHLSVDDNLIDEAKRLGHHPSAQDAVRAALTEYVDRKKQRQIIELFGRVDIDPDYDYKAGRSR